MTETQSNEGNRQTLIGVVVGDKMDKTITVAVERTVMHELYKRFGKKTNKFTAHDEDNDCNVGDRVEIVATRPLSKTKRWRVRQVVTRAT